MKRIFLLLMIVCVSGMAMAQPKARRNEAKAKKEQQGGSGNAQMTVRAREMFPTSIDMPENVVWRRDIYREIDLSKESNSTLYYPVEPVGKQMNLFTYIFKLALFGYIPVYEYRLDGNEDYSDSAKVKIKTVLDNYHIYYEEKDGKLRVDNSDIPSAEVKMFYLKESAYYDQANSSFRRKVLSLCPVMMREDDFGGEASKYPLFWVKYTDLEPYLSRQTMSASSLNNAATISADDYFTLNKYEGKIYKTNNLLGRTLAQYCPTDSAMAKEQKRIEDELLKFSKNIYGDQARKDKLVEYGFRLPSAKDNRPLTFDEFNAKVHQIVYCSATPGDYEYEQSKTVAEQVIRPTGLLDPVIEMRPLANQIDDLVAEIGRVVAQKDRVFVTTLTKRSAEDLSQYLHNEGIRVEYLHSDIDAIERVAILQRLRKGAFDVLVGINLLREGLDLPEVALVAILDADKEGFLRSTTSLVQTAGRTARHEKGRVILYADHKTDAIRDLLRITNAHRKKQIAYNEEHHITPKSVKRAINESAYVFAAGKNVGEKGVAVPSEEQDRGEVILELEREMLEAADNLEFERAAYLRDQIKKLKSRKG